MRLKRMLLNPSLNNLRKYFWYTRKNSSEARREYFRTDKYIRRGLSACLACMTILESPESICFCNIDSYVIEEEPKKPEQLSLFAERKE